MNYECEECNFTTKYLSHYKAHLNTLKHTGKERKKRVHKKEKIEPKVYKCDHCYYETMNKNMYINHVLAKHSSEEDKLKKFKYYCKDCKFGSNYESIYNKHLTTLNHKKMIAYKKQY